jgi:two-component system, NarL family, nitrate/nitrite response regulator NarL
MLKIELLLRSRLIKEALSSMLTTDGFSVSREQDRHDDHVTVIIDIDIYRETELIDAHRANGDKVVVLASGADTLEMDDERIGVLSGILTYDLSGEAFLRSLRLICAGERVFPRDLAPGRRLPLPVDGEARSDRNRLSPREREVLSHLLVGHANKVIARQLGTSEATVKVHLKNLLRKIKVDNRTQAAIWALSNLPELQPASRGFA